MSDILEIKQMLARKKTYDELQMTVEPAKSRAS